MEKNMILAWILILSTAMAVARCQDYYSHGGLYVPPPRKVTYLHFFLHDTMSGNNPSAVPIVSPNTTTTGFGGVIAFDDPLTVGPDITSEVIGNAQGLWVSTDKDVLTLMACLDIGFTKGEFNGSSIIKLFCSLISADLTFLPVLCGVLERQIMQFG
ncbi:hypothetical protein ES332_A04G165600v1 [Gossypium tomentosum]|uniref:Dirigent protein n=1 Tax=Gossypium tomentosum TaxID=34277 RepID=A0A5D2R0H5_GOSTO|nr:hypothetical protein ES332_A04G165600v1 [Gossypium tomentosum]